MYKVEGGVYRDVNVWKDLVPGTEESYGPFYNYDSALVQWQRGMFSAKLDIAGFRLFIRETE